MFGLSVPVLVVYFEGGVREDLEEGVAELKLTKLLGLQEVNIVVGESLGEKEPCYFGALVRALMSFLLLDVLQSTVYSNNVSVCQMITHTKDILYTN